MLDLANDQKFYDLATVALQASEHENELMLEGGLVQAPERYEDHIVHWQSHVKFIQTRSFKEDLPPEVKQNYFDHIEAHEYFMLEKAKEHTVSPLYHQKLQQLEGFPLFSLVAPPMAAAPGMGMPPEGPMPPAGGQAPPPMDESAMPEPTPEGEVPPEQQAADAAQLPPEEVLPPSASKAPFPVELR
jgi:hypothetical protein